MPAILPGVRFSVKEKLRKQLRRCRVAAVRVRHLIVLNLLNGRSAYETAEVLGVHNTTVYRVARRFREHGLYGLWDAREDNGDLKLDDRYLDALYRVVRGSPQDYGWRRPTWTRESLIETMVRQTGVRVHVTTMSRALALVEARRGRPRPTVGCPWAKAAKTGRLNALRDLVAGLPRREVAVYEDEVDVHLNPKIGLDWMARGQQKEVKTPGQNAKRYLAGALDARTGLLHWVEGARKTSALFLALLAWWWPSLPAANTYVVAVTSGPFTPVGTTSCGQPSGPGCHHCSAPIPPVGPCGRQLQSTRPSLPDSASMNSRFVALPWMSNIPWEATNRSRWPSPSMSGPTKKPRHMWPSRQRCCDAGSGQRGRPVAPSSTSTPHQFSFLPLEKITSTLPSPSRSATRTRGFCPRQGIGADQSGVRVVNDRATRLRVECQQERPVVDGHLARRLSLPHP
jgi:transposase